MLSAYLSFGASLLIGVAWALPLEEYRVHEVRSQTGHLVKRSELLDRDAVLPVSYRIMPARGLEWTESTLADVLLG